MFFGMPTLCLGLGFVINGWDDGALQRHAVEVRSKDSRKGRYFFLVKEFRPNEHGVLKVRARYEQWDRTAPGQKVVLVVGPGRLGWPWLLRVEGP